MGGWVGCRFVLPTTLKDYGSRSMRSRQRLVVQPQQITDQHVLLTAAQQHYLFHVLRLKVGDEVWILDGQGQRWRGQLAATTAQLLEADQRKTELTAEIVLCLALLKAANFEQVLQQATELGVKQIMPVQTARSLLQPSPQKYQRWRRILEEAAEQSERLYVPTLTAPITPAQLVAQGRQGYIASPTAARPLGALLGEINFQQPVHIAIGPEGGWTPSEVAQLRAAGWQDFSLGRRTLRAVTAAIASLSILSHYSDQCDTLPV